MNKMNSQADEILEFVKINVPIAVDHKKGKQVAFAN